jgi:hypothetical protein
MLGGADASEAAGTGGSAALASAGELLERAEAWRVRTAASV